MNPDYENNYALGAAWRRSPPKATAAQIHFLAILFNDLGFTTPKQRAAFMELRLHKVVPIGEISCSEASAFIKELKALKADKRNRRSTQ